MIMFLDVLIAGVLGVAVLYALVIAGVALLAPSPGASIMRRIVAVVIVLLIVSGLVMWVI